MPHHPAKPIAAAVLAAVLAASSAAATTFLPPSEVPAARSGLAQRTPMNALARAGERNVVAGQRGHILYSDAAGTWTQADVPLSADLTALSFPTAQQGWAVGHEGVVLHTSDGGVTWQRQLDAQKITRLLVERYGTPANPDDAAAQQLQKSAAGFAALPADKPLLDVWFEDEKKGFAVGAFNLILRTEDGGKNWTPWLDHVDNPKGLHLYAIRPAGGSVFIVGEQGLVLRLDRERQRFVRVALPYEGTLFGVVGTQDMVLVHGLRGHSFRSMDGGANWTRVETGTTAGLSSAVVRADGSVVLASQAGEVLLSTDAGASFARINTTQQAPVFAVAEAGQGGLALAGFRGVRIERLDAVKQDGANARKP
ncbi:YCF48-related protein [Variovorax sp. YR216]|uniref:WD40/YVTN/BNR-like repeat-containing protein n=1 Tax=Variovorax sp. YR216 TaxID=1882828 RepID=UPI001C409332|nr:YCF48-related protein [Variovorax sp. YR216]